MTERKEDLPITGELGANLAQLSFRIPGVGPEHVDDEGNVDPTMRDKIVNLLHAPHENGSPRIDWIHVADNIKSGKHTGAYSITSGAIIVTIGIGLEVKRHGKDIKHLLELVSPKTNRK